MKQHPERAGRVRRNQEIVAALRRVPPATMRTNIADRVLARLAQEDENSGSCRRGVCAWAGRVAAVMTFFVCAYGAILHVSDIRENVGPLTVSPASEQEARTMARNWLVRAQEPDGRWDAERWDGHPHYEVALTALSMLALLDDASALGREHEIAVRRAADYLVSQQQVDGLIGVREGRVAYNQGLALLALLTAHNELDEPEWRRPIAAGVDFIMRQRADRGGWSYGEERVGRPTLSATFGQGRVLTLAARSGWTEAEGVAEETGHWLRQLVDEGGLFAHGSQSRVPPDGYALKRLVLAQLVPDGTESGSWHIEDPWSDIGGRLYTASMACMSL